MQITDKGDFGQLVLASRGKYLRHGVIAAVLIGAKLDGGWFGKSALLGKACVKLSKCDGGIIPKQLPVFVNTDLHELRWRVVGRVLSLPLPAAGVGCVVLG